MKRIILPLMLLIVIGQSFSFQIAWKKKFDENVGFKFSRDGNEVLIRKSSGFEIYDRINGSLKRSNDSLSFFELSDDFNFGLITKKDTIEVYNTNNNNLISQILHTSYKHDSSLSRNSRIIVSPDNKYLIIAVSEERRNQLKHIKSEGWIDIFDLTIKNPDKPSRRIGIDSLGSIMNIFFDRTYPDQLYITDIKYDINESDSTITKNVYRYDLSQKYISKLNSSQSLYFEKRDLYDEIRIFAANPYGCAMFHKEIYISFSIIYPHKQTYEIEEALPIADLNMQNFSNLLAVLREWDNPSKCNIGFLNCIQFPSSSWLYSKFNEGFYSFEVDNGQISTSVNTANNWICLYIFGLKELIMFSDEIKNVNDGNNQRVNIDVYPTPSTDYIEISLPPVMLNSIQHPGIKIYNVFGELVNPTPAHPGGEGVSSSQYSILTTQYSTKIDVSALSPGVYFVRVGEKVGKFVKI